MTVWRDGKVTLQVQCDQCGKRNSHTITYASKKDVANVIVDFTMLKGNKRRCDHPTCGDYIIYH